MKKNQGEMMDEDTEIFYNIENSSVKEINYPEI
jgi:hypothetical protein